MTDSETLRRIVVECLERLEDEGSGVVDELCRAHPAHADALRRRLAVLGGAGLLATAPAAAHAAAPRDAPPVAPRDAHTPGDGAARAASGPLVGLDATAADVPERLGDFRLLARLGGGGMGLVYEAEQVSLRRRVALKLVRPEHLYFPGARERFRREIEAIARLQHPGIVPIHAVGEERGVPYLAMERVHGLTLAEAVDALRRREPTALRRDRATRRGRGAAADGHGDTTWRGEVLHEVLATRTYGGDAPAPAGDPTRAAAPRADVAALGGRWEHVVADLVRQAALALEHCHRRGVLHRDVKPSNLLLSADGRVQLIDFGIAAMAGSQQLTLTGAQLGSPPYMSPEQLRGEHAALDARTDVYSLGVTLYELLTLRSPYHGATTEDVRRAVLAGVPPRPRALEPALSRDVEAVCLKAMDVDRARRYGSAGDLARDLDELLAGRPVTARPPSAARRGGRWVRRHPTASVVLLAVVVVPLVLAWQQREARLRVDAERAEAQQSLQAALSAVDAMLLRVGDRTLADVPQMEGVRADLLADAQALLEPLLARHGDDPAVLRLGARARHRAGALQALLGRTADAEASFRAAQDILARFDDAALELATVRLELGDLLIPVAGRGDDARAALVAAGAALDALPAHAEVLQAASRARASLGLLDSQLGDVDAALREYAAAAELARRAVQSSDGGAPARSLLATALSQLGKLRHVAAGRGGDGDSGSAVATLEEAVALFEQLADEQPAAGDPRFRLGLARNTLGTLYYSAGRDDAALAQVRAARDDFARLVADFPRVPRYRLELAGMIQALAVLSADDPTRSEQLTREALALMEGVAAESPAQIDLLANVAAGHANLALNLAGQGRTADALAALEKSVEVRRRMTEANAGHPMASTLLDHQLRTAEMLLDDESAAALARALAEEAVEADLRDEADSADDARWSRGD